MSDSKTTQQYEDIDGLELVVEKKRSLEKFPEKEFILAKIVEGRKQLPTNPKFSPQLSFTINFLDEKYAKRKMWYNTRITPEVGNDLYNLWLAVFGLKELPIGEKIIPSKLIGKSVYVMIDKKKNDPEKQEIILVKHWDGKDDVASVSQHSAVSNKEKESSVASGAGTKNQPAQTPATDEINIDDINIDDL
jgi:hypothetical protein